MRKKPNFISHYLVLKDLLDDVDVRAKSDMIFYLTSRIENIKMYLKDKGLLFDEEAKAYSSYAPYKPYILVQNEQNLKKAYALLEELESKEILEFLENI